MSSEKRKRESGAAYRKRRLEKEETVKKLTTPISRYFSATSSTANSSSENILVEGLSFDDHAPDHKLVVQPNLQCDEVHRGTTDASCENFVDLDDPAFWPKILSDKVRMAIIENGPKQITKFHFPTDEKGRSFSVAYFSKNLSNGETVNRNWLLYSKSKNSVYCYCCKMFSSDNSPLSDENGFSDWQHLSQCLERHEKAKLHIKHFKSWCDLKVSIKNENTVDRANENLIKLEKNRWKLVIERIIHVIKFLAGQNLAFRGHSHKLFETNNGNFLKFVETIAQFDTIMFDHINRITNDSKRMPNYLGNTIQNEIVSLLGFAIKDKIKIMLNSAKYYSIILDCTPDVSHEEQITVVVRFVNFDVNGRVQIKEHFLGFCSISDTTGEGLTLFLLDFLNKEGINLKDMRGQAYDNGANMKGKHSGIQKRILDLNCRAFYIPCAAHTLNLVINDAAKASLEISSFFDIVQEIYVYFSASVYRWKILMEECPALTIKPLSETRWESRVDAIKVMRYNLGKIYDALYKLYDDSSRDSHTRNLAKSLILKIKSFKFICSIIIWYNILSKINILSKLMQKVDIELSKVINIITEVTGYLKDQRCDDSFATIINEAKSMADEIDCDAMFPVTDFVRPRKKKRMFSYETMEDERSNLSPEHYFKVNFFYVVLDTSLSKIEERFATMNDHYSAFSFLSNTNSLKKISKDEKMKYCMNLQIKLSDPNTNDTDINGFELCDEIENFLSINKSDINALDILEFIYTNELLSLFPNLSVAIRIFLTLPITVASGERSFSKLKLIKNYLRSTMSQERLSSLSIISIEKEICSELNMTEIINDFATRKARKIELV